MGCARSKVETLNYEQSPVKEVIPTVGEVQQVAVEVGESVRSLVRESQQLTNLVASIEQKIAVLDEKFAENEDAFDKINSKVESLTRRSKGIKKAIAQKRQKGEKAFSGKENAVDQNVPALGEVDNNILYVVE